MATSFLGIEKGGQEQQREYVGGGIHEMKRVRVAWKVRVPSLESKVGMCQVLLS